MIVCAISILAILLGGGGIAFSMSCLADKLKEPKSCRIWFGIDVLLQMLYPVYLILIYLGIHNLPR